MSTSTTYKDRIDALSAAVSHNERKFQLGRLSIEPEVMDALTQHDLTYMTNRHLSARRAGGCLVVSKSAVVSRFYLSPKRWLMFITTPAFKMTEVAFFRV